MDNFEKIKEGVIVLVALCALIVTLLVMVGPTNNVDLSYEFKRVYNENKEIVLPTFKSKEELVEILKAKMSDEEEFYLYNIIDSAIVSENMSTDKSSVGVENNIDYSETNVQVQGVDEADIVKTNGDYIYYLDNNILYVFSNKNGDVELVKNIELEDLENEEYIIGYEMYLDEDYLVLIGVNGYSEYVMKDSLRKTAIYDNRYITKVYVFDLENYEIKRKVELEGLYVSSRKIEDDIYLITNKYAYRYGTFDENTVLPIYKDTTVANEYLEIPATDIMYFPGFEEDEECTYMIIASFSLDDINEKANVETYIGSGRNIYCSKENLYVTKEKYDYLRTGDFLKIDDAENETTTLIRKFKIDDGVVRYVAEGEVDGTLLNQFSMDEYDGYFRITTTKGNPWGDTSENNLYVLDEDLNIVGTLEGLAKGEKIYSTRFMGEKAYVVTYKTVDPLFVIDLSKPTNPNVLGELKIPGYSSYLHPIDENHLIGFGCDSIEKTYTDWEGNKQVTAYENGLKMAIFDVTDYNNPKELYSVKIGGRGSYSELLYNHKALLYDSERGIFAFPASLKEENAGYYEDGVPKYGKKIFDGALVYNVDVEEGITLRGKIEHGNGNREIQRIIRIGENLYTLSSKMLKVSDINTIEEVNKLEF